MSTTACEDDGNGRASKEKDLYLTLVPRGFESIVSESIKYNLACKGYKCFIREIGPSPLSKLYDVSEKENQKDSLFLEKTSNDPLIELTANINVNKFRKWSRTRRKGIFSKINQTFSGNNCVFLDQNQADEFHLFLSENPNTPHVTGSIDVPSIESHISLGYHEKIEASTCTTNSSTDTISKRIITVPGTLEGVVLLSFSTNAPPLFVASMPCMGCLLALICSSCLQRPINENETITNPDHPCKSGKILDFDLSLEQSCVELKNFFTTISEDYFEQFQSALDLWYRHAENVWCASSIYGDNQKRIIENGSEKEERSTLPNDKTARQGKIRLPDLPSSFKYRLSLTRTHSKKYTFKRETLVPYLAQWVIPWGDLHRIKICNDKSGNSSCGEWTVDLNDYDFDIVTIIHSDCVSVAIPLRPYQRWGSKAYSSNSLPTDGAALFGRLEIIDSKLKRSNRNSFVHLKPSIADILISLADLNPHSVVLDPCAGIGTINIRASLHSHYGIGGELVPFFFSEVAPHFLACNRVFLRSQCGNTVRGVVDMAGWDATMLPLRDAVVDAVISDIPFGQKCLSHNELNAFLPGFLYQCARVLVENGKMILLCGNVDKILACIVGLNQRSTIVNSEVSDIARSDDIVFHLPLSSAIPVNIGGFLAWAVAVRRGKGQPCASTSHRTKPRKRKISYAKDIT